jgi:quinol monooxygenase YgiN
VEPELSSECAMTTIAKDRQLVSLINVFTVKPDQQQEVVDRLVEATEKVMKHVPGFISANIHKSLDGVRVVNYAQWKSREHFEAMLSNPAAIPHMDALGKLVQFDAHLYEVVFVDEAG